MESRSSRSRQWLQIAVGLAGCVPVFGGLAGVVWGLGFLEESGASAFNADSHFRYLSGLLLGIGIAFWTTIPRIERETTKVRILAFPVVLGGFARLAALLVFGFGEARTGTFFAMVMELLVTPGLVFWQASVSASQREPDMLDR